MAESKAPVCVADVSAVLGEGPVWVTREEALYWVDIKGERIFRMMPRTGDLTEWRPLFQVASLAPRDGGGFVAGTAKGFAFVDPAAERYELHADPEPERPSNRFNDGKLDRLGHFWAGTMDDEEVRSSGALYRLDRNGSWHRMDDEYRVTNGPAFSPDGRLMYHNDSALQITYVYDLDEAGAAANRRIFRRYDEREGYPDGMTVDSDGCLWIAFWDGWCIRRYAPDGELIETIEMPVQRPTSCTFGGERLDELYVTSARIGLDDRALFDQPQAGGLFMLKPGVPGLPDVPYRG